MTGGQGPGARDQPESIRQEMNHITTEMQKLLTPSLKSQTSGRVFFTLCFFALMAEAAATGATPNVLIVTIDTLRADRLGCYGYKVKQTPVLDNLAREGTLFERAFTAVPLTLPAHCTLFTGAYPPFHGVRDNAGSALGPEQKTLAEVLKDRGYRTAAFVGAFVLDSKFGLNQGFDTYVDHFDLSRAETISPGYIQRRGDEVVQNAINWFEKVGTRDFFAWVHLYDPHDPYTPPEPFLSRHPGSPYDGEVEFVDQCVGTLLDYLKKREGYDNTLIVVVGDHGESLGDHGEEKHGFFIYNSVLHVPFIVRLPLGSQAGRRVAQNVSIADLFPTVLQVLQIPGSVAPGMQGRGLLSLILGKAADWRNEIYAESYYPRLQFGWSELRALITAQGKFILAPQPELYQLDADFEERRNLAMERQSVSNQMQIALRTALGRWSSKGSVSRPKPQMDSETAEKLRSLGYVGYSMGDLSSDDYKTRSDPKGQIQLYNRITALLERSSKGEFSDVIPHYEEIINQQPQLKLVHYKLGQAYFQTGRYEEAVSAYSKAVFLGEDSALASYDLALAYMKLGRAEAAIAGFRRAIEKDPRHFRALTNLGVLLKNRGHLDEAVVVLRQALQVQPTSVFALNNLGTSLALKREYAEAVAILKQAIALDSKNAMLHANLGRVYQSMGQDELAAKEFQMAKRLDPTLPIR